MNYHPSPDRRATLPSSIRISLLMLLLCTTLKAQSGGGDDGIGTGGANTIRGRVYLPTGPAEMRIKVRLESTDMANLTTVTDLNGSFRFSGLQGGNYTIIIDGDDYYEMYRESISIEKQSSITGKSARTLTVPVYLRLKARSGSETAIGTVDATLAKVPQAAQDLYRKGLEASRKGDGKAAVDHLKGAIALYPEFVLALNELGVQYLKMGKPDKAVEALRSALKLGPEAFITRLNYGIALLENRSS
jgi:tetratricopeptide (TPR) repeat protein